MVHHHAQQARVAPRAPRRHLRRGSRPPTSANAADRPRHRLAPGYFRRRRSTTCSTTRSGSARWLPSLPSSNQYRVVEGSRTRGTNSIPKRSITSTCARPSRVGLVPLSQVAKGGGRRVAHLDQSPGSVSRGDALVQPSRPAARSAKRVAAISRGKRQRFRKPDTVIAVVPGGTAQEFQNSLRSQVWLLLAALVTVYIVLGVLLRERDSPPDDSFPPCPPPGSARC